MHQPTKIIEEHFPDTTIDDDCNHKDACGREVIRSRSLASDAASWQVEALNGHAKGVIKNSSGLSQAAG